MEQPTIEMRFVEFVEAGHNCNSNTVFCTVFFREENKQAINIFFCVSNFVIQIKSFISRFFGFAPSKIFNTEFN